MSCNLDVLDLMARTEDCCPGPLASFPVFLFENPKLRETPGKSLQQIASTR